MPNEHYVHLKNINDIPTMAKTLGTMLVNETGSWRNIYPIIDNEACTQCGICWKFCPDMSINEDSEGYPVVDLVYCKGCGVCAAECPKGCIEMVEEGK
ncbi:4Fe-4S binding protein [bacterium]|nr:4Fe-4S binding protein [bacterium]